MGRPDGTEQRAQNTRTTRAHSDRGAELRKQHSSPHRTILDVSVRSMANTQMVVVPTAPPSDGPVQLLCPRCQQMVLSKVDYTAGLLTYLFCGGLFLCGCVLGCCLIPFCVNRLKNAKHSCPTCRSPLGVYKRL